MIRTLLMPVLRNDAVGGAIHRAAQRDGDAQAGAAAVAALDRVVAAETLDALLHAAAAESFWSERVDTAAVVAHREPDERVLSAVPLHRLLDFDIDTGRLGVADRVGEALLDAAIER